MKKRRKGRLGGDERRRMFKRRVNKERRRIGEMPEKGEKRGKKG